MTHGQKKDGECCDACAIGQACEVDCPDNPEGAVESPSGMALKAEILARPLIAPQPAQRVAEQILAEIRAPIFEGKPLDKSLAAGSLHIGLMKWDTPPRGFRPEVEAARFCVGDSTSAPGPTVPFELSLVEYGTSVRDAEFSINKSNFVSRTLACFSFNGGTVSQVSASSLFTGGPAWRIPYDAQSGKFNFLFWKVDLTGSVNPGRLVIHDRWVPVHEVFPPGVNRRPFQETV